MSITEAMLLYVGLGVITVFIAFYPHTRKQKLDEYLVNVALWPLLPLMYLVEKVEDLGNWAKVKLNKTKK
jgi:F0F1-type ATP synthase membrane subunit a